ncbi:MAG: uracil-DNA glycosylase family protein [Ginsengibacter sp.]
MSSNIETHPHPFFIPTNPLVLLVGSFPGRHNVNVDGKDEWFYSSPRNQFWPILRKVYNEKLLSNKEKKACFEKHGIAIGDLFLKIRRKGNTNSDSDIEVIEYNNIVIEKILKTYHFHSILFTSKLVQKVFLKFFPEVTNSECLPSPSPRFARMSLDDKVEYYKKKLPV